ncbi:peptidoglycan DD-metalloendopeptidase family protein [Phenylobacterium sp.]|uniref:murein hydrolase activator EnvC family protein n=1 Tax=Phenylobacterium sp. TaxID=1871053 RepID=UPI00286DC48B|nr:peptidoglycan DD-metalloendopeptidase family protein [Phenylobacterium sp.]
MPSLRPAFVIGALASLAAGVVAVAAVSERDKLQSLNVRETVLTAEQGRNLNRLARLLTVLEQFRRDPPPALLVSPDDAVSAVRAAILVKAITPELQRRARLYAAEAGEIARQRRLAAVASEALFTADSELAEARLIQPPGQRDRTPLPEDDGEVTPPKALMAPADGRVTRRFGQPVPGGGKTNGLTIETASGAKVAAPDAGLVQYVGPVKGWGVILILRLAGGYHLVLAGLDRVNVDVGQSVAAGAPVGWMADGRQTPPELYLEVRERGAPVNPGRWMTDGNGLRPTVG